jgi:hypothetical protein
MRRYLMIVRHQPDTQRESECGWWYTHHQFDEETDELAIERAHRLEVEIGAECSNRSAHRLGYACDHSVDELYRVGDSGITSIYDDGVYQCISWDKNGNTIKTKRVTDAAARALLRNPLPD